MKVTVTTYRGMFSESEAEDVLCPNVLANYLANQVSLGIALAIKPTCPKDCVPYVKDIKIEIELYKKTK